MEYRTLGRTGLRVSPIALGTMNFGPVTPEHEAHEILNTAHDLGINLIDTADVYGADANRVVGDVSDRKGLTEQIIGRWMCSNPRLRDEIVLVTKAYGRMGSGPNDMYASSKHLRNACEASLRRLQTDHVDIFMLHHVDRSTGWAEIWETLEDLRQQGKILYAGTSNFPAWHLVQGQEAAARRDLLGIVVDEPIYNLMQRSVELELAPACHTYGIGLLPYSPLNSGLLGGILAKTNTAARSASSRAVEGMTQHRRQLEEYEEFCRIIGHTPAVVAQAWLLSQPPVTAPIVGARTIEHLQDAVAATNLALADKERARLDEIFPPVGPAPEAYAW